MRATDTAVHTNETVQEQPKVDWEDQALLAAALAAALVEYRRHVRQRSMAEHTTSAENNWRTMACWERLRGRG
jgi:hypothetical protein